MGERVKQNATGVGTFLPVTECSLQMATPNISIHELLGLWPTLLRSDVCVCTKADLFHHKMSVIIFIWSLLPLWEETI